MEYITKEEKRKLIEMVIAEAKRVNKLAAGRTIMIIRKED